MSLVGEYFVVNPHRPVRALSVLVLHLHALFLAKAAASSSSRRHHQQHHRKTPISFRPFPRHRVLQVARASTSSHASTPLLHYSLSSLNIDCHKRVLLNKLCSSHPHSFSADQEVWQDDCFESKYFAVASSSFLLHPPQSTNSGIVRVGHAFLHTCP